MVKKVDFSEEVTENKDENSSYKTAFVSSKSYKGSLKSNQNLLIFIFYKEYILD